MFFKALCRAHGIAVRLCNNDHVVREPHKPPIPRLQTPIKFMAC